MKKLKPLPDSKTEAEEFEFWATHDFTDYLDPEKFVLKDPPMVPMTPGLIRFSVSPEMEREVEQLSRERKVDVQELIRQLLAAGLQQQRVQPGA